MSETYPYGYVGVAEENLSAGYGEEIDAVNQPDLKESFTIGPSNPAAEMPPVMWPEHPAGFQPAWEAYWGEMDQLSGKVMSYMATALELEPEWFNDKRQRHRSALRALNYPAQKTAPQPGQIRAGAHTDYGAITILWQDENGGLQVRDRDNKWHDVPYMRDGFVINLGDLMERWTNDRWVSTLHRVVNPEGEKAKNRRQSVAFFHNVDHDYLVDCIPSCSSPEHPPKYAPILAWDHLMEKHLASTLAK